MYSTRTFWIAASGLLGLMSAGLAPAAEAGKGPDRRVIEEVIVTATYRETSLMDTAQSVNALDESVISEMGALDIGDLFQQIPGLNMSGTTSGSNRFTVRGVTSQTGTSFQNYTLATVGVYLDNTPVTSALGPAGQISGNMFDIQRLEVLKGPHSKKMKK